MQFALQVPMAALFLAGPAGSALADTSDVKGPAPLLVAKSGKHCSDDPNCFNRFLAGLTPACYEEFGVPQRSKNVDSK